MDPITETCVDSQTITEGALVKTVFPKAHFSGFLIQIGPQNLKFEPALHITQRLL